MSLERISAVAWPVLPARPGAPEVRPRAPTAGETLRLTVGDALHDEVHATLPDGVLLRLIGLGPLVGHLSAGDLLTMKVLTTSPHLELALTLFEPPAGPGPAPNAEPTRAMMADQLGLRQLRWQPPEAAALAATWRAMVLNQVEGEALAIRVASQAAMPTPGERAAHPTDAWFGPPIAGPDRWLFPAYAWGGLHVMLRLVEPDDDESRPLRRRRGPMALRIVVQTAALGRIELCLSLLPGGVALVFFVERPVAMPLIRQAASKITRALSASGTRLLSCGVVRGASSPAGPTRLDTWPSGASASAALPPPLFRAAAEATVAIAPLLLPRDPRPSP